MSVWCSSNSAKPTTTRDLLTFVWEVEATEVSTTFLLYRIFHVVFWTVLFVLSIWWDQLKNGSQGDWLIYFTHWGMILGLLESYSGLILVAMPPPFTTTDISSLASFFWVSNGACFIVTCGLVVSYWTLDFPLGNYELSPQTFIEHGFNALLMCLDIHIVAQPLPWTSFVIAITLATAYINVFTSSFYFLGCTTTSGKRNIYPILEWQTPWKPIAVSVVVGVLFFSLYLWALKVNQWKMEYQEGKTNTTL